MKESAKITDASLELLELREIKCSLEKLVSISIRYYLDSSKNGGKRERSNVPL